MNGENFRHAPRAQGEKTVHGDVVRVDQIDPPLAHNAAQEQRLPREADPRGPASGFPERNPLDARDRRGREARHDHAVPRVREGAYHTLRVKPSGLTKDEQVHGADPRARMRW